MTKDSHILHILLRYYAYYYYLRQYDWRTAMVLIKVRLFETFESWKNVNCAIKIWENVMDYSAMSAFSSLSSFHSLCLLCI